MARRVWGCLFSKSGSWKGSAVVFFGMLVGAVVLLATLGWTRFEVSQPAPSKAAEAPTVQLGEAASGARSVAPGTLRVELAEGQRAVRSVTVQNDGRGFASWIVTNGEGTEARATVGGGSPPVARSLEASTRRQRLRQKVAEDGRVRVIVEVDAEHTSEKRLSAFAVQTQRRRIASAQQRVVADVKSHTSFVWTSDYLPLLAVEVDEEGLERLMNRSDVKRVMEDKADPLHLEYSTELIEAPDAWADGHQGQSQTVVILDSGTSNEHPFLDESIVHEACFSTENSARQTQSLCPNEAETQTGEGAACNPALTSCDHGTHVAGIAAGQGPERSGVAPEADLIPIQVFSRFNDDDDCDGDAPCNLAFRSDQLRGLEYAYQLRNEYNIAAVNMSLGGGRDIGYCDDDPRASIVGELRRNGIATVTSSGNDGYTEALGAPACLSTTISVGSSQDGSDGTSVDEVSSFSNSAWTLDFLAPGEGIVSSVAPSGYGNYTGTSMAAPHVAGAWALLKSRWPDATVEEIQARLDASAEFVTDSRNDITRPRIALGPVLEEEEWMIAGPTRGTIPPDESEEISVVVDAGALPPGTHLDTFTIDRGEQGSEEVVVEAEVVEAGPARAEIEPRALTGDTRTGTPIEIVQTITNTANSESRPLRVRSRLPSFLTQDRVVGSGAVVTDSTIRIQPQTTATVVYRFEETAETHTVFRDSIVFETNDPEVGTVTVPTEVAVRVPRADIEPAVVDFGVVSSEEGAVSTVSLTNVGTASYEATASVAEGEEYFSVSGNTGTVTVPPGESREIELSSEAGETDIHKGVLNISHDAVNMESPIQVDLQSAPSELILRPPFPNPLQANATIEYSIPEPAEVHVEVYDILGRRVALLRQREEEAGIQELQWDGRSSNGQRVASGPYFVRIRADGATRAEKIVVVR